MPGGHDHIIAMVAVAVTDDVDAARTAADRLALYDSVPSNQKVNAGGSRATELAVVGTAEAVTRQLKTYIAAGATDVVLEPLQTGLTDLRRVWDMAAAF